MAIASDWTTYLRTLEEQNSLPVGLLSAIEEAETGAWAGKDNRNTIVSPAGAQGRFQFMPATAKRFNIDPNDPYQAAQGAAQYLSQHMQEFNDPILAAAAYNAGEGRVREYGGVPPFKETQGYIQKVGNHLSQYQQEEAMPEITQADIERYRALKAQEITPEDIERYSALKSQGGENPSHKGTILNPIGQGATFGLADELAAGGAAAIGKVLPESMGGLPPGTPFVDAYTGIRDNIRENTKGYAEENPKTALAAEIGGGLLTGGFGAAKAAGMTGVRQLPKLAQLSMSGAAGGGLYGFGTGEGAKDSLQKAKTGAIIGGVASPAIGFVGGKLVDMRSKSKIMDVLRKTAPTQEEVKQASHALYKTAKDSGVVIRNQYYKDLLSKMGKEAKDFGFDLDLHPKTATAISRFMDKADDNIGIDELEILRKKMQAAALSNERSDATLARNMLGVIDDAMDSLSPNSVLSGKGADVGGILKQARALWGKQSRMDMLNEAVEKARNQASGFENGIRVQMRSILNNPKKLRGFSADDVDLMKQVVRGGTKENILKLIGKMSISENQQSNLLGMLAGMAAGGSVGGAPGAIAMPIIGQAAKKSAQKLTRQNADNVIQSVARGVSPNALYAKLISAGNNPAAVKSLLGSASDKQIQSVISYAQRVGDKKLLNAISGGAGMTTGGLLSY